MAQIGVPRKVIKATASVPITLRVSTGQPPNLASSPAFCAPANWRMMHQLTCFYRHEKAQTAHSPANLATGGNGNRAPPN